MTGEARYDTYTVSSNVLRAVWVVIGLGAAGLLLDVTTEDGWSPAEKAWLLLGLTVIVGLLVVWVHRVATVTTPEHVAVRGLFRTRRIPWSRVQAIAIELNPGRIAESGAPNRIVVVYDDAGRRITLPHLNEKRFERRYGNLESEVDGIRAAWLAGRGEAWAPVAHVQARAAEVARRGLSPWLVGLIWAFMALPIVTVLALVTIVAELALPWPMALLAEPEAILVVPTVVYLVAAVTTLIARRWARGAAVGPPQQPASDAGSAPE